MGKIDKNQIKYTMGYYSATIRNEIMIYPVI